VDPRAGQEDVVRRKFLPLLELELRPLGLQARSQSLYGLRYSNYIKQCLQNVSHLLQRRGASSVNVGAV
jgi:hypothetical protein